MKFAKGIYLSVEVWKRLESTKIETGKPINEQILNALEHYWSGSHAE
jgi:hypothetical protein